MFSFIIRRLNSYPLFQGNQSKQAMITKHVCFKHPNFEGEEWGTVLDKILINENGISVTAYLVQCKVTTDHGVALPIVTVMPGTISMVDEAQSRQKAA